MLKSVFTQHSLTFQMCTDSEEVSFHWENNAGVINHGPSSRQDGLMVRFSPWLGSSLWRSPIGGGVHLHHLLNGMTLQGREKAPTKVMVKQ